ncbi:uncharacterized protein NPIL_144961 [Nephila pilipes]|uniref:Sushi domain-containing protein n=1 Tax=Nephila pilipes TaxID=299642 RepID=A0A8X6NE46_NEPPI|nr:uncharacterized protein NPIL_144961 [Nephila pilipes]
MRKFLTTLFRINVTAPPHSEDLFNEDTENFTLKGLECGYPGAPSFGRPHPVKESYRPGDAVSFTCAHGHSLQGPLQRVCLFNGTWGGQLPLCGIIPLGVDDLKTKLHSSREQLFSSCRSFVSVPNFLKVSTRNCQISSKFFMSFEEEEVIDLLSD